MPAGSTGVFFPHTHVYWETYIVCTNNILNTHIVLYFLYTLYLYKNVKYIDTRRSFNVYSYL